jgi:hypothetical protein
VEVMMSEEGLAGAWFSGRWAGFWGCAGLCRGSQFLGGRSSSAWFSGRWAGLKAVQGCRILQGMFTLTLAAAAGLMSCIASCCWCILEPCSHMLMHARFAATAAAAAAAAAATAAAAAAGL